MVWWRGGVVGVVVWRVWWCGGVVVWWCGGWRVVSGKRRPPSQAPLPYPHCLVKYSNGPKGANRFVTFNRILWARAGGARGGADGEGQAIVKGKCEWGGVG